MIFRTATIGFALAIAPACYADETPQVQADIQKTDEGRILTIEGSVLITAKPSDVWAVMTDCPTVHNFVPALKKCEVLEADPNGQWDIRRHTGKGSFPLKGAISEFRSEYSYPTLITFSRTGGDYDTLNGSWVLEAGPEQTTKLTYKSKLSASIPAPNGMVKNGAKKRMRKTLEALKEAVEATD